MPSRSPPTTTAAKAMPLPAFSVPLVAKKTAKLVGKLDYHRVELPNKQRRLAGRYALRPDVDLSKFETRAVIDWLQLGFLLSRKTQFQWVQREAESVLGTKPWVVSGSEGPNNASLTFDVRIQEPEIAEALMLVRRLEAKFGLDMDPVVRAIEVSVDFRPATPNEIERAKMLVTLTNHLMVKRDIISHTMDRPRYITARGPDGVTSALYHSRHLSDEQNNHFLFSSDRDRAPSIDSTYALGAKGADVRWGVMDKVLDSQNPNAGTFVNLDEASKRVRIEVTLDRRR